jgi:hypothetical protein
MLGVNLTLTWWIDTSGYTKRVIGRQASLLCATRFMLRSGYSGVLRIRLWVYFQPPAGTRYESSLSYWVGAGGGGTRAWQIGSLKT